MCAPTAIFVHAFGSHCARLCRHFARTHAHMGAHASAYRERGAVIQAFGRETHCGPNSTSNCASLHRSTYTCTHTHARARTHVNMVMGRTKHYTRTFSYQSNVHVCGGEAVWLTIDLWLPQMLWCFGAAFCRRRRRQLVPIRYVVELVTMSDGLFVLGIFGIKPYCVWCGWIERTTIRLWIIKAHSQRSFEHA